MWIIILLHSYLFGQDFTKVDSLSMLLKKSQNDTSRIYYSILIAQNYLFVNLDTALSISSDQLIASEKLNYKNGIANSLHNLAMGYTLKDDYSAALPYVYRALKVRNDIGDRHGLAAEYIQLGNILTYQSEFPKALENYDQANKIFSEIKDTINTGISLTCIGNVYTALENYPKALEHLLKSLTIIEKSNNSYLLSNLYSNLGMLYNRIEKYELASVYLEKGLKIARQISYTEGICGSLYELAFLTSRQKQPEKAIIYASESLKLAQECEQLSSIKNASRILYEVFLQKKDYKNALKYFELSAAANDSIFTETKQKDFNRLSHGYDLDLKQTQIELLNEKQLKQRNRLIILSISLLIILIFSVILLRSRRKLSKLNSLLSSQKEVLRQQKEQISEQRDEIQSKHEILNKQNAELKSLNEQKNHFIGMAAHDLRNPLGTIFSSAEIVEMEISSNFSPEAMKFTKLIQSISSYSLKLVNDILDIAKIESGNLNLSMKIDNYIDLINESIEYNRFISTRKNITISLVEPVPALSPFSFDKEKINQVLNNLIENAIKFSNTGTEINVRVIDSNGFITTEVIDQGAGIKDEEIVKLFKEFSTTSTKSTGQESSSGLGLAICKKIIETHGGTISVRSEAEKGSIFFFTIPYIH